MEIIKKEIILGEGVQLPETIEEAAAMSGVRVFQRCDVVEEDCSLCYAGPHIKVFAGNDSGWQLELFKTQPLKQPFIITFIKL